MRLSTGIYLDQGVAVPAFVEQWQLVADRAPAVALGDDACAGGQHRRQRRRQLPSEGTGVAVWGVEEDQIVLTRVLACGLEIPRGRLTHHFGVDSQCLEVAV